MSTRILHIHTGLSLAQSSLEVLLAGWFGSNLIGKQPVRPGTYQVGLQSFSRGAVYDEATFVITIVGADDYTGLTGLLDGSADYGKDRRLAVFEDLDIDPVEQTWQFRVRCYIKRRK